MFAQSHDRSARFMKLPPDSEIPIRKVTHYLLVPRVESDKSIWLSRGGYTSENPHRLVEDIRSQILPREAIPARSSRFGETFEIRGVLQGPSDIPLSVRTIWLKDPLSGMFRLITLIPSSGKKTS
jgi:hypothetical protein